MESHKRLILRYTIISHCSHGPGRYEKYVDTTSTDFSAYPTITREGQHPSSEFLHVESGHLWRLKKNTVQEYIRSASLFCKLLYE